MSELSVVIDEVQEYSDEIAIAIRALVQQLDDGFQPLTEQDIRTIITSSCTHLFLAKVKETNQIVGMITLVRYRIPYKMKGIVEDIVVDTNYRRQGIGEQLIQYAIAISRQKKVHSLDLTSRPERGSANTLYQKLGFQKRDTNVYRMIL